VYDCLLVKKGYIEEDEFDYGIRRLLNYGHCFGHAMESVSHFEIPHGLAVVVGMIFAYIIAAERGLINKAGSDFVVNRILLPHLHLELIDLKHEHFDCETLFTAMKKDKKHTGGDCVALIMPQRNFQLLLVQDISYDELVSGVAKLKHIIYQNQSKP
jgi:3-dehydroquinate synthase